MSYSLISCHFDLLSGTRSSRHLGLIGKITRTGSWVCDYWALSYWWHHLLNHFISIQMSWKYWADGMGSYTVRQWREAAARTDVSKLLTSRLNWLPRAYISAMHSFIHSSIHPCIHPSMHLSTHASTDMFIHWFRSFSLKYMTMCILWYISAHPSVHPFILHYHPCIMYIFPDLFIYPSIPSFRSFSLKYISIVFIATYPSIHPSIHPAIFHHLCKYAFIHLCISLFFKVNAISLLKTPEWLSWAIVRSKVIYLNLHH